MNTRTPEQPNQPDRLSRPGAHGAPPRARIVLPRPRPMGARRSPRSLIPPPRRLAATLLRGTRAAALALLALAALAFAAAENAAAQTVTTCAAPDLAGRDRIWTGELTVGMVTIIAPTVGYGFFSNGPAGALDDTTFNIGRNGYVVDSVSVIDGNLSFNLTSRSLRDAEVDALRLHVCDTPFDFSDAVRSRGNNLYRWNDNLDWSSLSSRTLYLSLPEGYTLPPGAPTGLSAQSVSGKPGYLRLSWTPASDSGLQIAHTTDYEARYRKTGAPDWSPMWSFRSYGTPGFDYPATTHAVPRGGADAPLIYYLDPNTEYQVEVRAINAIGESGWSNRASATTAQATTANDDGTAAADNGSGPAAAPSQPTVRRVDDEPGLMVRWNAPRTPTIVDILAYEVEVEKERERDRRITTLSKRYLYKVESPNNGETAPVTYLVIPGLDPNTTYTVRVRTQYIRARTVMGVTTVERPYSGWSPDTAGTTAATVRANNIQLSLEYPDGTRSMTAAPGAKVTYRVKATGIHDWAAVRARGGIGKAQIRIWEHGRHHRRMSYYRSTKGITYRHFINQTGSSGYLEGTFIVPDEAGAGASGAIEIHLIPPSSRCGGTGTGSRCSVGSTVGSVNRSTNKLCIAVDRSGTIAHPCSSGQTQAVAPTVEGTPGLSASGSDGSWAPGETVEATVTFSEAVTVVTSSGTPSITLTLGGTVEQSASYTRGSGTKALVFAYTLSDSDGSHTAMGVSQDSLALNGGSITSEASGADADLGHNGALIMGESDGGTGPRDGGIGTRDVGDVGGVQLTGPTASFSDLPATHDGEKPFTVKLSFSAKPRGLSYKTVRDMLLEVTGGTVTKALRVNDASDREWKVTVKPSQGYDITLTLPARACSEMAAVCIDGRTLSRAASATIPGKALTAALSGPAEHDGSESFTVRLTFSMEPDVSYKTVRDTMFIVTGGAITGARRFKPPHDREFDIVVKPGGNAAVSLSLASSLPACGETGAVCTAPGRKIEGTASVTVLGPVAISVADARAEEATGATVDFTVTLSRAASRPVTVDYATSDGTATAGADYTATSGALTFAAGTISQTVSVPVLDDIHDDDGETFTLTFSNPSGAWIADGQATGTIENSDPLPRAWLARFGRTTATHVTDAIGERLRATPGQASHLTVGGYRLPLGQKAAAAGEEAEPEADPLAALVTGLATGLGLPLPGAGGAGPEPAGGGVGGPDTDPRLGQSQTLHLQLPRLRDVLLGSSFRLTLAGADAGTRPRLTAWGRVAATQFNGQDGDLTLDGDVLTGTVGVDGEWDRWLAGVAVSHSRGDGSYTIPGLEDRGRGELDNTLTSIHPYLRYAVNDRLDVWGVLGYGWGELTLEQETDTNYETDTTLVMGAVGGRGILLPAAETGGFQLATRTDAMFTRTTSEAVVGLASADADAHRLRVVLEGSRALTWADGRSLTPTMELGLRHDWGDAETGFGVELGGRVQYTDPRLGLTLDAAVRGLLAHEDNDYDEWGASGSLRLAPGAAGQGLSLTLAPTWGAASSGVDGLWTRQTTAGLAPSGRTRAPAGRLNAEVGYGLPAPFGTGLLTPYAGTVFTDGAARTYRLGTRWTAVSGLSLTLEGRRQESPGQQPVNQGLQLQIGWGF